VTEKIRENMFPALVMDESGGVLFKEARVLVGEDRVWVYVGGPNGKPVEALNRRVTAFEGRPTTGWRLVIDDDSVLQVKRSQGCACGSLLRGMTPPFPHVYVARTG